MSSRAEHYIEAEKLLAKAEHAYHRGEPDIAVLLHVNAAQVHATLAVAPPGVYNEVLDLEIRERV